MTTVTFTNEGGGTSTVTFTNEGGGTTAACECGWLRFATNRPAANKFAAKHAPKCKGAPVTQEPAPVARRGASNWNKREGLTWLDKL